MNSGAGAILCMFNALKRDKDAREQRDREAVADGERRAKEFFGYDYGKEQCVIPIPKVPLHNINGVDLNGGPEFKDFYKGCIEYPFYNGTSVRNMTGFKGNYFTN